MQARDIEIAKIFYHVGNSSKAGRRPIFSRPIAIDNVYLPAY